MIGAMIEVAAIVFRNSFGHVLGVRKASSTKFQLPGGKLEEGESPVQAAAREAEEEIGVQVRLPELTELGTFTALAANEPGQTVCGHIFTYPRPVISHAAAEIAARAVKVPSSGDSGELEQPLKAATAVTARTLRGIERGLNIGIIYSAAVNLAG